MGNQRLGGQGLEGQLGSLAQFSKGVLDAWQLRGPIFMSAPECNHNVSVPAAFCNLFCLKRYANSIGFLRSQFFQMTALTPPLDFFSKEKVGNIHVN